MAAPQGVLGAQTKPAQTKPANSATVAAPPPAGTTVDGSGWPRAVALKSGNALLYQPQVQTWTDQKNIVAWSAVSYQPTGAKEPALGTVKIEGTTAVAVEERAVRLDLKITEYNFKTLAPEQVKTLVADVQALPPKDRVIDLDRLLSGISQSTLQVKNVEGIKADPPKIYSAQAPAMLINLDGDPIWSPIKDVDLRYALNTNWDLFEHTASKIFYVRYNESWLQATSVQGPWTPVTDKLPDSFKKLPADTNWEEAKKALPGKKLSTKTTPKVFVSTTPAELIMTEGAPEYQAVLGATTLLWVKNTEADLFRMGKEGDFYFLVAGRWFKSASLDGPWTFTTPSMPEDFKRIPVEHPRSRVLASIPGTPQATEAVLLAMVPRTARVNRKDLKAPEVVYQGNPEFKTIDGAQGNLQQAVNTDKDIIKFGDLYYMCFQGVWFMSKAANGPWEVASTVPKEIYTIPASSSAHNVTYVTVVEDDDDDEWVTFAYVAAYTGMMIGWGCAVWGSGYYYPPYVRYGGFYPGYYPYPHTYGMGAYYNPYTGAYGRGYAAYGPYGGVSMGARYNPTTGTYSRGATAYGPYGSRSAGQAYNPRTGTYAQTRQGSNVYGNWGTSSVQRGDQWAQTAHRDNYRTGTSTSGIRTSSGAAAIGREGPAGNTGAIRTSGGDIYAGHDGNVYQKTDSGWQQMGGVATPTGDRGNAGTGDRPTAGTSDRPTAGTSNRPTAGTADRATTGAGSGASAATRPSTGTGTGSGASAATRPSTGTGTGGASATTRPSTGSSGMSADQVRQLEGDRSNRVQGNDRTTSRSGWESSGSSRSGAGSYGGSSRSGSGSVSRPSGGAMRSGGGGGRRR
jgi:hypothetical protein